VEKYDTARWATDDNIILHMCSACWIIKATDLHSEYVIIIAVTRQQWLHKRTSMLCLDVHLPVLLIPHSINSMADARTCEMEATLVILTFKC